MRFSIKIAEDKQNQMKITFSNLGAIKKTTLDLRPLTVIIGPNNSNKTYIAYSVYGLLEQLSSTVNSSFLNSLGLDYGNNDSENVSKLYSLDENGVYSLKIDNNFFNVFTEDSLSQISGFENRLDIFFQDSSKKIFKKTRFGITFTNNEIKTSLEKLNLITYSDFEDSLKLTLKRNILQIESAGIFFEGASFAQQVALSIGFNMKRSLFSSPILLPAERSALITTYKILESRRYNLLKEKDRESIKQQTLFDFEESSPKASRNIRYPEPIEDFLKFLTDLDIETKLEKGDFGKFADTIEKNLQQKNKTNYKSTKFGGKEIKINVKKGLDIDLYNASSSIKQLTPLLLYLRYRAKVGDLLIIDEPEMNLHPESQAKFLEILGMLVNAGVNVLLTTHSPYFMSHLNNLVSGKTDDEAVLKEQAKSLYLGDERAFLKMDDVSAYEMKNNKLKDLKDKDYGIRWDTLSDVSADIQQKFFEIYEKGDTPTNGEEE